VKPTMLSTIRHELKEHVPFTASGTLIGVAVMVIAVQANLPESWSGKLFEGFHSLHVLCSALATAGMYRLHSRGKLWATFAVGYFGCIGVATLSDCLIPYLGEWLLDLPNRRFHLGFIEKWWLINPLAAGGIALAYVWPNTKFPHAGHVLLSTAASLFHMVAAMGSGIDAVTLIIISVFLFCAVWIPCCTSDVVFPLLFSREEPSH